jgi:hypothetical protein
MPSWKTPTPEQIERTISLLARPEQRRYFFDKLNNPRWLTPLAERGFFSNPPEPLRDNTKGTVQFLQWPALQYLTRMASIPEAQDDVLRIALNIPGSDNITIHDSLAEIATNLPAPMAAQFVPRAAQWLNAPYRHRRLATYLGTLINHLATNGQSYAAEELARVTLAITKDETRDVYANMEPWDYGQTLKEALPGLRQSRGMAALTLTCDLLQTAAPPYTTRGKPPLEDGSTIWHDEVEEDGDLPEIKNLLVSATRDTAAQLAHQQPHDARTVIEALEARPTIVFHRIALDILRREKDAVADLVSAHITKRDLFDSSSLRHEYQRLLHDVFPTLDPGDRDCILKWINDGPPTQAYEARITAAGKQPTPEDTARYQNFWRRRQLTPIAEHLPPTWAQRYRAIIDELGPEPHEPTDGFIGPTSPITKEDLAAMTAEAFVGYLASWTPTDELLGPSRAGIGQHLTGIVATNPTLLDGVLDRLRALHPTYLRSYFYGLREASEKKRAIAWQPVLDLATWIVSQTRDAPIVDTNHPFDDDQGWVGARSAIADLLNQALNNTMPVVHRDAAWRIIAVLAEDPEPTPEYEATYGATMDAPLVALNTIRGKALEAVIKYALMLHRHQPEPNDFTDIPEVRAVLDDHLQQDPSVAIRTVYGRFFPWLVLLDNQWARANADRIFGDERGSSAWDAYVTFCPAYDNAVALLTDYYHRATDRLQRDKPPPPRGGGRRDPDEHLGEHLMTLYYRGHLLLTDGLVPRFFERAPAHARAHAIEYVGRILYSIKEPAATLIRERLVLLWAARRQAATTALEEHRGELAAFGWWFAAGKLDTVWELDELRAVLRTNHAIAMDYQVIDRLANLAGKHAPLAVECLCAFLATERQYWTILGAEKRVRSILAAALQVDVARQAATALIHELGVMGYTKFRDLLLST